MARYLKTGIGEAESHAAGARAQAAVEKILNDVGQRGDAAVRELSERFDNWSPPSFGLSPAEIEACITLPTMGAARYTGGLWVGKFLKTVPTRSARRRLAPSSASIARACVPSSASGGTKHRPTCVCGATVRQQMNDL